MIAISNFTTFSVQEGVLKKIAKKVLKEEGKEKVNLSIILVGPEKMKELNKKYRGEDQVTDVLSFGQSQEFPPLLEDKINLGEIVICLREVKRNAKKFNFPFKKELSLCLIHGILHLLGYDHEDSIERAKEMENKQQCYLEQSQEVTS